MGNCCTSTPRTKVTRSGGCCSRWRKFWSCRCSCCGNNDQEEASCAPLANGKVYLITEIRKWEEKISEANRNGNILVVNFSASWCMPCRTIATVYHELADRYPSILFVTIDVEELAEFTNEWNVDATPTFIFLKDGRQVDKLVGANKAELQKKTAAAADLVNRRMSS